MILALLCMAACQLPEEIEEARVEAIVSTIVGRTTAPGMPLQFVDRRRVTAEGAAGARVVSFTSDSFDTWVFANMAGRGRPEAWIESVLRRRLITYGTRHGLTEAELAKLYLAGRGDAKRLFGEVEKQRERFEARRHDSRLAAPVLEDSNPLCRRFQNGPFEEGSLFARTLAKIVKDREASR